MADNKIKKILKDAKSRVVVAVVVVIALIGFVLIAWHHHATKVASLGVASVASAPQIQSLPGAGNPTNAYVDAQNKQNAEQAKTARKDATSFVPTITRQSFIGSPEDFAENNPLPATGDVKGKRECPIKKVVYMYKPNPANCTLENLRLARSAGVTAEELLCQSCSCPALRVAGYTAGDLKDTGYSAADLRQCGYSLDALMSAGFTAADLKAAGFSATQLKAAGFSAGELKAAGFTPEELKQANYSAEQLQAAGISPNGTDCSVAALQKSRAAGISASELRNSGCGLAALKAAGFTAAELKSAGFSAAELRNAGFTADALKAAGFTAAELRNAGFSADALKSAGFNAAELEDAGFTAAQLKAAGFSASDIAAADARACNVDALKKARMAGASATALKAKGCGLAALKAAGFSAADLKAAGFSAAELKSAGFSAAELKSAGFSAADLKAAGFNAAELKSAGFSASDLKDAGFSADQLKNAGFSAEQLRGAGFSAQQLRNAGYSASDLKNAGFSAAELKAAGFSAGALKNAGFSANELSAAGFDAKALRNAGFTAAQLKAAGFSAAQLRNAGYTKGDLLRGGYTAKDAGYQMVQPNDGASNAAGSTSAMPVRSAAIDANANTAGASMPSINSNSPEARLRAIQQAQQQQLNQQQRRDMVQQMQGQMSLQAQKLLGEWSNNSPQTYQAAIQPAVATQSAAGSNNGKAAANGPVFKAGTILFAVLDTSINSDEKSPILATIVTGDLKGAKIIGNFQRVDKKVLIRFNLMNVQSFDHTFSFNAVAIDPDTARTAISGDVNNHYLLRYGTLFASAFLSGLSQGIIQSGSTQDCFLGFCHNTYRQLNPGEYVALGLGNVGQQYSTVMADNFRTPPTIKIAGGTGIGVLIMSDVTLPQPLPEKNIYSSIGGNNQ